MKPGVRLVNRDPDSGTRRLFDQLLEQKALDATRLDGHERVEFTTAAGRGRVASGMADAASASRRPPASSISISCVLRPRTTASSAGSTSSKNASVQRVLRSCAVTSSAIPWRRFPAIHRAMQAT